MDHQNASEFVFTIRNMIGREIDKTDSTSICEIVGVDKDGAYTVSVFPDGDVIHGVVNQCAYRFNSGDVGIIYKVGNSYSNCFLIAKKSTSKAERKNRIYNQNDLPELTDINRVVKSETSVTPTPSDHTLYSVVIGDSTGISWEPSTEIGMYKATFVYNPGSAGIINVGLYDYETGEEFSSVVRISDGVITIFSNAQIKIVCKYFA